MLYTDAERVVMAHAIQINMRAGDVLVQPFEQIIREQGLPIKPGMRILDIGPGQCDFLDVARRRGAQTVGIDFDPAICELGRMRGHEMHHLNLRQGWPFEPGSFDGIFCRGSFNPFWFSSRPERLDEFLKALIASLRPGGWLWVAPWSQSANVDASSVARINGVIDGWLALNQLVRWTPPPATANAFGIAYSIPRLEVWRTAGPAPDPSSLQATLADYAALLTMLCARGDVEYLTYRDLPWKDDADYRASFPGEWKRWRAQARATPAMRRKVYLLIQHDTDSGPAETVAMAKLEAAYGARSSIMTFARLPVRMGEPETKDYAIDWDALLALQSQGFEIGYHCNALHLAGFDTDRLASIFEADVSALRARGFDINFFTVHGGVASASGQVNSSYDYCALTGTSLRWVNTRYSPRFDAYHSDGGSGTMLPVADRMATLTDFVVNMRPGRRYRLLIHPQYFAMVNLEDRVCFVSPHSAAAAALPPVQFVPPRIPPNSDTHKVMKFVARACKAVIRKAFQRTRWYERLHVLRHMPQRLTRLEAQLSRQKIESQARYEALRGTCESLRKKNGELHLQKQDLRGTYESLRKKNEELHLQNQELVRAIPDTSFRLRQDGMARGLGRRCYPSSIGLPIYEAVLWTDGTRYVEDVLSEFRQPFVTVSESLKASGKYVAVRHDVDWSIENALAMAELEHQLGVRATYYLLHPDGDISPSNYFGRVEGGNLVIDPEVFGYAKRLIDLGHEVGLHNDLITLAMVTKRQPANFLDQILTAFRRQGIEIKGTVAHGSIRCHERGYVNYQIFEGMRSGGVSPPDISSWPYEVQLGNLRMEDFGLEYEAGWVPAKLRISDSSAKWRIDEGAGRQQVYEQFAPGFVDAFRQAVHRCDGGIHALIHADHWSPLLNWNPTAFKRAVERLNQVSPVRRAPIPETDLPSNVLYAVVDPRFSTYDNSYKTNAQHFVMPVSIERWMDDLLPKAQPQTVLELGCGQGQLLALVRSKTQANCMGVDGSVEGIRTAAAAYPECHWAADTVDGFFAKQDLPTLPQQYDMILDKTGVTFLKDYEGARQLFETIRNKLTPGGRYVYMASRSFYQTRLVTQIYSAWPKDWLELAAEIIGSPEVYDDQLPEDKGYFKRVYVRGGPLAVPD